MKDSDGEQGTVTLNLMSLKKVLTAHPKEHPRRFWFWPARPEVHTVSLACILPVRPDLTLAKPSSTCKMIVFSVNNVVIIDKFIRGMH